MNKTKSLRLRPRKSCNDSGGSGVCRDGNNTGDDLGKVAEYGGIIPFLVKAAKKKNMRFDINDFKNGEVKCLNNHVVAFRGAAHDFLKLLF